MTLREKINNLKESAIFKLVYENKVIGLRVKLFNVNTESFEYYDFTLDTVSGNQDIKNFVNSLQSNMSCIELLVHNNLLVSQEEMNGSIVVKEFKSESDAVKVLTRVKIIYEL